MSRSGLTKSSASARISVVGRTDEDKDDDWRSSVVAFCGAVARVSADLAVFVGVEEEIILFRKGVRCLVGPVSADCGAKMEEETEERTTVRRTDVKKD